MILATKLNDSTVEVKIDGTLPVILVKEATSSPPSPSNVRRNDPFQVFERKVFVYVANHNRKQTSRTVRSLLTHVSSLAFLLL